MKNQARLIRSPFRACQRKTNLPVASRESLRAAIGLYEHDACGYTLSAHNRNFAPDSGTGSITVTTGGDCRWMASGNASWVKVTSGDNGDGGNKTVNFSVAPPCPCAMPTRGLRTCPVPDNYCAP